MRGQVIRELGRDEDGKAVMFLRPKVERTSNRGVNCIIPEEMLWQLTEEGNPENYEKTMMWVTENVFKILDLGEATTRNMAELASVIQEGINEVLFAKPIEQEMGSVIGEGRMIETCKDTNHQDVYEFEVTDTGLLIAKTIH